jgi:NAD(P)-dependent dehydrogenase (short-subunit alcohol dehydrogenase family)
LPPLLGAYDLLCGSRRADVLDRAAEQLPGEVTAVPADLTVPADVERLAGTLGHVDVVVNNVTGTEFFGGSMTPERHERLVGRRWSAVPASPTTSPRPSPTSPPPRPGT